jgi:UDP-N-acetylglucosamine 2-epimerase
VVTGGRADYGLLYWVMRDIAAEPGLALQLIVTGSHLEPRFGETVKVVKADGFRIDARVPLDLTDDTPAGVGRSMARALSGVGEAIERLRPDLLLVLGIATKSWRRRWRRCCTPCPWSISRAATSPGGPSTTPRVTP